MKFIFSLKNWKTWEKLRLFLFKDGSPVQYEEEDHTETNKTSEIKNDDGGFAAFDDSCNSDQKGFDPFARGRWEGSDVLSLPQTYFDSPKR